MNMTKNQRNSNLELLRIIAMLFIVAHHFAVHGFSDVVFVISNPNNYLINFLGILGKIGVDVFILISAYFMINSKFTFRKLLLLGGGVYFYSIMSLIIFSNLLTPAIPITLNLIRTLLLPISHSAYWFITCYIVLMLISPFLNKFIKSLSKKNYLKLLLLLLIIWSIYPSFTGISFAYDAMLWFIVLYLIGSFIKLHLDIDKIKSKKLSLILLISLCITYIGTCLIGYLGMLFNITSSTISTLLFTAGENEIFILIISVSIFLIFLKRKEFSNKYINYVAGSVLGVYLIHDNILIRPYIWKMIFGVHLFYSSPFLILIAIISIFLIYLVCTGIDIIRRLTIEKIWIWIVDNKLNNIPNWVYNKLYYFGDKFKHYLK